jgi:hypothetical protein
MSDIAYDILSAQRTPAGRHFEKILAKAQKASRSSDPKIRAKALRLSHELIRLKEVKAEATHANQFLTNLSVKYANDELIGTRLMPFVGVDKRSDQFLKYDKRDNLNAPNDELVQRGKANEVTQGRSTDNYSVKDYGLEGFVAWETVANQDAVFDEVLDVTIQVNDLVGLKREIRQANILQTGANYAGNTAALSGSDQFDAAGSDPAKKVRDAISGLWRGPSGSSKLVCWMGLEVYNVLRQHPKLLDLFKYQVGGFANRQKLAEYFEVDEVLVGAARYDTANSGQAASYSRIWGKNLGIVRVANSPSKRSAHFGSTFRLNEDPVVTTWFDQSIGKKGGMYSKVAVSEDYKVVAGDTSWLYTTVIS